MQDSTFFHHGSSRIGRVATSTTTLPQDKPQHSIYTIYRRLSAKGGNGDWDFRIYDLVKNPDGNDI